MLGPLVIVAVFPWASAAHRRRAKQAWSAALCRALAIDLQADVRLARPGSLLVANHISWIDIFVINAVLPAAFVSKEEVRHWPLIGWLAARNDTVFLRRGSRGHARIVNQEIGQRLAAGQFVAVFPEGTTTDGTHVRQFHAALLQAALEAGRPIVPLAVSYCTPSGDRSLAPRYDGDISLGQCLRSILGERRLVARLVAGEALGLAGEDRRSVARAARSSILANMGLSEENEAEPAAAAAIADEIHQALAAASPAAQST